VRHFAAAQKSRISINRPVFRCTLLLRLSPSFSHWQANSVPIQPASIIYPRVKHPPPVRRVLFSLLLPITRCRRHDPSRGSPIEPQRAATATDTLAPAQFLDGKVGRGKGLVVTNATVSPPAERPTRRRTVDVLYRVGLETSYSGYGHRGSSIQLKRRAFLQSSRMVSCRASSNPSPKVRETLPCFQSDSYLGCACINRSPAVTISNFLAFEYSRGPGKLRGDPTRRGEPTLATPVVSKGWIPSSEFSCTIA